MSEINVNLADRSYPIVVEKGAISRLAKRWHSLDLGTNVAIITNPSLVNLYANKLKTGLEREGAKCHILTFEPGESHKTLASVAELLDTLLALKFERIDTIIALGGGIVGDVAGFVASIYLRGIHLIQCPTTLLAQVDASIGGKTGVNHPTGKNLIGSFYQPLMVISDTDTLSSLSKRELLCGLAEVVKYGFIRDVALFDYMYEHAASIRELNVTKDASIWEHLVTRSAANKADVVSQDERESGLRETLNLGHTFAHGIEAATHYTVYLHGEAVAIGMRLAADLAVLMGELAASDRDKMIQIMTLLGFDLSLEKRLSESLLPYFYQDKKVRHGKLRFVLPTGIGSTTVRKDVSEDLLRAVLSSVV
jgi:3-dehydroquinate synthase